MIDEAVKELTDALEKKNPTIEIVDATVMVTIRVRTASGVADNVPVGRLLVTDYGTPGAVCSPFGSFNPNAPQPAATKP